MEQRRITGDVADQIWDKLEAFANFGFPESHSVSFSYLVYISAWLKYHYPAAFCASLLNAQPMGFWAPHTLVADARRHGVIVKNVDINASAAKATVDSDGALRLGISYVRSIGEDVAKTIEAGRPYADVTDVVRRCNLNSAQAEALATSGAFSCFEPSRRKTMWTAGAAAKHAQGTLPGFTVGGDAPDLPEMNEREIAAADLWATSLMPNGSPTEFIRPELDEQGVLTSHALKTWESGRRVKVAGVVTHRQRPSTAEGVTFLNLEDETGLVNVICSVAVWRRYKKVARSAKAMIITGRLERVDRVINLIADRMEELQLNLATSSRDFR
jgi:error-prone DNA polymerase